MKPVYEKIPAEASQSFHCERVRGAGYGTPWHFHPELELTLVRRSQGHRMVGDRIARLEPGDLVLVGANLPHVWHQDTGAARRDGGPAVDAIVVQFTVDFLGAEFLARPELQPVRALFGRAGRGLHVRGETRRRTAAALDRLMAERGLARLVTLLGILHDLSRSTELRPIASVGFQPRTERADLDRMERVCRYIDAHLAEPIYREKCAAAASLSEGAFSRFFRTRTGHTLAGYVNQLRIGRACRLLTETDEKITGVAAACGFGNLANFNLAFRAQQGLTPREYREKSRQE